MCHTKVVYSVSQEKGHVVCHTNRGTYLFKCMLQDNGSRLTQSKGMLLIHVGTVVVIGMWHIYHSAYMGVKSPCKSI